MILFWYEFNALLKEIQKISPKSKAEDLALGLQKISDSTDLEKVITNSTLKSKKKLKASITESNRKSLREILSVLNASFFKETLVWGHPAGEMNVSSWMLELIGMNPRTPYTIFIYDYDLMGTQWGNYKRAFLD